MIAKKIDEEDLRKKLITIYEAYVNERVDSKIRKLAGDLYRWYLNAEDIIDRTLYKCLGPLDGIAWPGIIENSSRPSFPKEEAKKILEELKKTEEKDKESK
ncbi:MAG: hypothetical protein QW103_01040 [Candidatus Pacearchaeota archaeon]